MRLARDSARELFLAVWQGSGLEGGGGGDGGSGRSRCGGGGGGGSSSLLIFWVGSTGVEAGAEVAVSQFAYRPRLTFFPPGNKSGGGGGRVGVCVCVWGGGNHSKVPACYAELRAPFEGKFPATLVIIYSRKDSKLSQTLKTTWTRFGEYGLYAFSQAICLLSLARAACPKGVT